MSHYLRPGDGDGRRPLLHLQTDEMDSDEGEIIFDRGTSYSNLEAIAHRRLTYEEAVEEAARCDLLLTSSDMGLLTASIFLGMMVGGYMWGYLADQKGRCRVLVLSLTVNGVFGGLASMAPSFWLFLLLRFISGIGVGGSIPVIFSYFSEFMPRLRRGTMISALATFWMAGNILAAGLAWLVIPRTWAHFFLGGLDFQSWRLFVVLCSIPSLTSALLFKLVMPESPKFLMEAGQEREALRVFRLMFEWNIRGKGKTFLEFGLRTSSKHKGELEETRTWQREHFIHVFKTGLAPVKQMFNGPLKSRSFALLIIFYCISFSYYGLWMWFPELFARVEDSGSPCANISRPSALHNESCYPVKTKVYVEGFAIAASNLPGNIFTILSMDRMGGKALLCLSLLVSSLSVFFIYLVQTKSQSLFLSCVFSAVSVIAWNSLDVLGTELFPTQLRSSALGFFTGVGRVAAITGNIVFGKFVDTNCAVPILLVSSLLFTGGLVALLLPQTRQTELS
ncbi:synaptic vesicle glycoprotein 2C isoform X2 [Echeneis naucrates]|uniref:synaptic vesicle glycoprotein 2C isoform X2 n=1 Tax=Echeneis naucrates TaxID=173247 RepID=UPI0011134FBD|nr:synaptic vesicle glycoprotein 2C-like isoform X2 [Echeneis naucrates]